jgi:hypothetical protein
MEYPTTSNLYPLHSYRLIFIVIEFETGGHPFVRHAAEKINDTLPVNNLRFRTQLSISMT